MYPWPFNHFCVESEPPLRIDGTHPDVNERQFVPVQEGIETIFSSDSEGVSFYYYYDSQPSFRLHTCASNIGTNSNLPFCVSTCSKHTSAKNLAQRTYVRVCMQNKMEATMINARPVAVILATHVIASDVFLKRVAEKRHTHCESPPVHHRWATCNTTSQHHSSKRSKRTKNSYKQGSKSSSRKRARQWLHRSRNNARQQQPTNQQCTTKITTNQSLAPFLFDVNETANMSSSRTAGRASETATRPKNNVTPQRCIIILTPKKKTSCGTSTCRSTGIPCFSSLIGYHSLWRYFASQTHTKQNREPSRGNNKQHSSLKTPPHTGARTPWVFTYLALSWP